MPRPAAPTRRSVLAGLGALVVAVAVPIPRNARAAAYLVNHEVANLQAFVGIAADGVIRILCPSQEMGQGISTGLAQIVADELDADWSKVKVLQADEGDAYRSVLVPGVSGQMTGGSNSVRKWRRPLRKAGAQARAMLVQAAAARWNVRVQDCTTANSVVTHPDGHSATYAELAAEASEQKPPKNPPLKAPAAFTLMGKAVPREDLEPKVTGTAQFGIDVRLPGMLRACTVTCPVFGAKVKSVDASAVEARPGVYKVLVFPDFVAVMADSWWRAKQAAAALQIEWTEGPNPTLDSAQLEAELLAALDDPKAGNGKGPRKKVQRTLDAASTVVEATFTVPYVDQAPMEPLNCTVHLQDGRCDVWVGSQNPTRVREHTAELTGLDVSQVQVHTPYLGGGFGRRSYVRYADQAVQIALELDAPVQLIWSREEQTRHGRYRPAVAARLRASVEDGRITAWHTRMAGDNVILPLVPGVLASSAFVTLFLAEGFTGEFPYAPELMRTEAITVPSVVPVGFWRSVGHSYTGFMRECFIDELAEAAQQDPVAFRRSLLRDEPRLRAVLDRVAEESGWGSAPDGHFQGVAIAESYGSICAQVVELRKENGTPRLHRITAVIDAGAVINPDQVKAQVMGGALYGISSALGEQITIAEGRVKESNFHDYAVMRMNQSPVRCDVFVMDLPHEESGGVGEPGTPPSIPAFCNAWFAATGERIRNLPLSRREES